MLPTATPPPFALIVALMALSLVVWSLAAWWWVRRRQLPRPQAAGAFLWAGGVALGAAAVLRAVVEVTVVGMAALAYHFLLVAVLIGASVSVVIAIVLRLLTPPGEGRPDGP